MPHTTELADAMPDGDLRQCCECYEPIAVGSPIRRNAYRVQMHDVCPVAPEPKARTKAKQTREPHAFERLAREAVKTLPRLEGESQADYARRVSAMFASPAGHTARARPEEPGDLGDRVVARLERRQTELPGGVYVTDLMGSRPAPSTGPDLGDQVVARIARDIGKATPAERALCDGSATTATAAPTPPAEAGDLGDRIVARLQRAPLPRADSQILV